MRGYTRFVVLTIVLAVGLTAVPIQAAGPLDPVLCLVQSLGVPAVLPTDCDGDTYDTTTNCNDANASIHPGAPDAPDMAFVDANCDGIDGDEAGAVFVAPSGNDAYAGTRTAPLATVGAGIAKAGSAAPRKAVYVQAGNYVQHLTLVSDVGIYGGYNAGWATRSTSNNTALRGGPEAILAAGVTGVKLQNLHVVGLQDASDRSTYGIRAINGSSLILEALFVSAGNGQPGASAPNASPGAAGASGGFGAPGSCDSNSGGGGGAGGFAGGGFAGGNGGAGGYSNVNGSAGFAGAGGGPGGNGGNGGAWGNPGLAGGNGLAGTDGLPGSNGAGATATAAGSNVTWLGATGGGGIVGVNGKGGGGGGGGGGQDATFVIDGKGNGGGGGGAGGRGGNPANGGTPGGGSFALYLWGSSVSMIGGSYAAGNGGNGGAGGPGGQGGLGGSGAPGAAACTSEVGAGGAGGNGGRGGQGGHGGGGAGGPTIAVFTGGGASQSSSGTSFSRGAAGAGGTSPGGPAFSGAPGIDQNLYP